MTDENDLDSLSVICPNCGGDRAIYMGRHDYKAWFQCRDCGSDYWLQEFEPPEEKAARLAAAAADQVVEEEE